MKKLFGFLTLFLCLLLTACNMNLLSDRSGSIDFSVPTKDIINAANNYAARSGDDEPAASYTFLVQIKGNRNYYKYQVKTVTLPEMEGFDQNLDQQLNYSQEYLSKENLDFSFTGLPLGQTYTVMFDMLVDPSGYTTPYSVFSGRTEGVKASSGQATDVGVKAKFCQESKLSLIVDYADGSESEQFRTSSYILTLGGNYNPRSLNLSKKNGKLYDEDKVIKDIYYVLDSDSNFISSAFNYSIPYFDNGHKYYKLNFKNNKCSVKSFLLRKLKTSSFSGEVTISNSKIECSETLTTINLESKNNLVAEHTQAVLYAIPFHKVSYNNKYAYAATLDISGSSGPIQRPISSGDTVVLVINIDDDSPLKLSKSQLYYKLSSEDFYDSVDGEVLFKDNNCINHKDDENYIIIPLNNIKNPNDYLILFEDFGEEVPPNDQHINCSITYYIFPSDMHVFAFGVGQNYDDDPNAPDYRYEFNQSIGKMSLNAGDTVKATIHGRFCTVNYSDQEYVSLYAVQSVFGNPDTKLFEINGELYDGGQYTPANGEGGSEFFHPLSNDEAGDANVKTKKIPKSALDNEADYQFVFDNIITPHKEQGYINDFRFLCTAGCLDPAQVLLIQYYNLTFTKN